MDRMLGYGLKTKRRFRAHSPRKIGKRKAEFWPLTSGRIIKSKREILVNVNKLEAKKQKRRVRWSLVLCGASKRTHQNLLQEPFITCFGKAFFVLEVGMCSERPSNKHVQTQYKHFLFAN